MKYYLLKIPSLTIFKEEGIEEVLRERVSHYLSQKKTMDFWLTLKPNKTSSVLNVNENDFSIYLYSTNENFIRWMKVRFLFVLSDYDVMTINPANILKYLQ
jgi:hypothetical protein